MTRLALVLLLLAGCSPSRVDGVTTLVIPPDSVRWVQQDKLDPQALVWSSGIANLWRRGDSNCTSPTYPYPSTRYSYSVVYRAQFKAPLLAGDTLRGDVCSHGGEENCTVDGGTFWVVNEGDTVLRGLAETNVTVHSCGARTDVLPLTLVPAIPHGGVQ